MALDPALCRISYHAQGGMKLSRLLAQVDVIRQGQPDIVFLKIGTNDLASGIELHALAQEVKRFETEYVDAVRDRVC